MKILMIYPPSVFRATMKYCLANWRDLTRLMVIPVILSSLFNAFAGARFAKIMEEFFNQTGQNEVVSLADSLRIFTQHMMGDWVIWISFMLSLYMQIAFMRAVIINIIAPKRRYIQSFFWPNQSLLLFFGVLLMILLLVCLPGSILATIFLQKGQSVGAVFIFFLGFVLSAFYLFARLSPSLVAAAKGDWLNPLEAFQISKIKGYVQAIITIIFAAMMASLVGQSVVSGVMANGAVMLNSEHGLTSLSYNLIASLGGNIISYMALLPVMVAIASLFRTIHSIDHVV